MKPVETYLSITQEEIEKSLKGNSFIVYQGQNLLFLKDTYTPELVLHFLGKVFNTVSKIAIQSDTEVYYGISNKYASDVIEPFKEYKDISERLGNNLEALTRSICTRTI